MRAWLAIAPSMTSALRFCSMQTLVENKAFFFVIQPWLASSGGFLWCYRCLLSVQNDKMFAKDKSVTQMGISTNYIA